MKVLMFGWEFPPYISGGLGTACFGLTKHMSMQGAEIMFVLPKIKARPDETHVRLVGPNDISWEEAKEKEFEHLAKTIQVDSFLNPYYDAETYKTHMEELKRSGKLASTEFGPKSAVEMSGDYGDNLMSEVVRYSYMGKALGRTENFDIIHAHDWLTYLAGVEAKKMSGKPLVVHMHATEFDRCGENINTEIFNIEKYGMEQADYVIAVSYRTRDMVIQRYGIDPNKVGVVHNAVEKSNAVHYDKAQRPFKHDKIVLYLGRITMQKGPDYFVEAANLVLQKVKNVRFVMAGSGDMTRRMIERMASLKLAERFHFTGFLGEAERERIFAMSDLYVMPSVSEPFGITPLEAMKYNIPIIISKQSGIAEILDHVIKVDFWDVQKLASSIINVLTDPALGQSMGEHNSRTLERIDWGIPAQLVLKTYGELLNRR